MWVSVREGKNKKSVTHWRNKEVAEKHVYCDSTDETLKMQRTALCAVWTQTAFTEFKMWRWEGRLCVRFRVAAASGGKGVVGGIEVFKGGTGWFQHAPKQRHSALSWRGGYWSVIAKLGCWMFSHLLSAPKLNFLPIERGNTQTQIEAGTLVNNSAAPNEHTTRLNQNN